MTKKLLDVDESRYYTGSWFICFLYGCLPSKYDFAGVFFLDLSLKNVVLFRSLQSLTPSLLWVIKYAYTVIFLLSIYVLDGLRTRYYSFPKKTALKPGESTWIQGSSNEAPVTDLLKPLLFPCRTTHTRLFPKKHIFSYSYLLVGIPVGWQGSVGSILGADTSNTECSTVERAWLEVDSEDHLERGESQNGLRGKLHSYLQSQNEDPGLYPYAYLATAPKFLGYSFNPVSFWYLYDSAMDLKAIILEVNNTFDERRPYFLKYNSSPLEDAALSHGTVRNGHIKEPQPSKTFAQTFEKDFHVSPFNSRKGFYSLKAVDPFNPAESNGLSIRNVITLSSSKNHPKLIANIISTGPSIDPSRMGVWDILRFLRLWCWVGFATYPRIVKEAGKLFFKRKLHVWFRPEVLRTSIGRRATVYERAVAPIIEQWLRNMVESSSLPSPVNYDPAIFCGASSSKAFTPKRLDNTATSQEPITLKPTSPLFYSEVAKADDPDEALHAMLQCSDPLKSILYSDKPDTLMKHFQTTRNKWQQLPPLSTATKLRWLLIYLLRGLHYSDLDIIAMYKSDPPASTDYRRAMVKLLLAKRIALGFTEVIDLALWVVRSFLLWLSLYHLVRLLGGSHSQETFQSQVWFTAQIAGPLCYGLLSRLL